MTSLKEHFQKQLTELIEKRQGLISEISRLNNGDDTGLFYSADPNREEVLFGEQRIAKMIDTRIRQVSEIEIDVEEHCRLTGLQNPIPKGRTV